MRSTLASMDPTHTKRLGRGLQSLLQSTKPETQRVVSPPKPLDVTSNTTPSSESPTPVNKAVPLGSLIPNRYQPRSEFRDSTLDQLAQSIIQHGVLQPIVVRRARGTAGDERYEIIAGERRWRAASRAGLQTVPVIIRDVTDQEAAEWALVENLQRADLNALERASAFARLGREFGLTHVQIAERVGLDRSSVVNFLRLLELEPEIQDLVRDGRLSFGHARALLAAPPGERRISLAKEALTGDWSVRRTERTVSMMKTSAPVSESSLGREPAANVSASLSRQDVVREDLERRIGEFLGTRVTIQQSGKNGSGRLQVEFFDPDQFESILQKIGIQIR
jgi:ParB family transcriptional regulator, chromosome partitioning protein